MNYISKIWNYLRGENNDEKKDANSSDEFRSEASCEVHINLVVKQPDGTGVNRPHTIDSKTSLTDLLTELENDIGCKVKVTSPQLGDTSLWDQGIRKWDVLVVEQVKDEAPVRDDVLTSMGVTPVVTTETTSAASDFVTTDVQQRHQE